MKLAIYIYITLFFQFDLSNLHEDNMIILTCKMASYTPTIDGKLDEHCWYDADKGTEFHLLRKRGLATEQTEIIATYDAQNLYLGIKCFDSDIKSIKTTQYYRDGIVWQDDCVEVFIDVNHDHKTYFHLISNSHGIRYDEIGRLNPGNWNPNWRVGTNYFSKGWSIEIALPFKEMGITTPQPGQVIGFNVNRQQYKEKEQSGWSETFRDFHEPEHFGHLVFVPIL